MNLEQTVNLFKSLDYEPNKYAVGDAKTDIVNHRKLGSHILHIVPYKEVPLKQIKANLKYIGKHLINKPSQIDKAMNAVVMGNINSATDTIGLSNVRDEDLRLDLYDASHDFMSKYGIDSGFGDSKDKNSWRNRDWIEYEGTNKIGGLSVSLLHKYIKYMIDKISRL